jgi:2-polyprenyl-3-methyl-5-hydroxy-6-metoxy-1,4-benzoquinol methylase
MSDNEYEVGRDARKKEMRHILKFAEHAAGAMENILDIGAGSGVFVEVACQSGYKAIGIEPSKSLVKIANLKNLEVNLGTFPSAKITGRFDLISLIDVIEHLNEPSTLIKSLEQHLAENGTILVSTPDVSSNLAIFMKWKWWHYRIAHIGYFDLDTLDLLMKNCGYRNIAKARPVWYFNADYLFKRIAQLLTKRKFSFRWLQRFVVRVNLHDSILCAYQKL